MLVKNFNFLEKGKLSNRIVSIILTISLALMMIPSTVFSEAREKAFADEAQSEEVAAQDQSQNNNEYVVEYATNSPTPIRNSSHVFSGELLSNNEVHEGDYIPEIKANVFGDDVIDAQGITLQNERSSLALPSVYEGKAKLEIKGNYSGVSIINPVTFTDGNEDYKAGKENILSNEFSFEKEFDTSVTDAMNIKYKSKALGVTD